MTPPQLRFRARPYVCGMLGNADPAVVDRLVAASPVAVQQRLDRPDAQLWSSAEPEAWQAGTHHGLTWSRHARGAAPTSWRDAAEHRLAEGLAWGPAGATLHTDALGLGELYVRRLGDAACFASRIEPLLRLVEERLHVDWAAWSGIFTLATPLGDATPFQEVRRMTAASAWVTGEAGLRQESFEPGFVRDSGSGSASGSVGAEELAALLRPEVPTGSLVTRVNVTLSGGWDSRLLGALAAQQSRRRVRAWTTSTDDGKDHDLELSRPVARALGMRHELVVPDTEGWLGTLDEARHRLQHQTWLHTWLVPLARELRQARGPLVDGLAGDVLLKSLYVDDRHLELTDPTARRRLLWEHLGGFRVGRSGTLAPGVSAAVREHSWEAFDARTRHLDDHPSGLALAVLQTRTTRAIAASPLLLFAPECQVSLPFVHPDVVRESLRVPVRDKIGGGFYRRLLEVVTGPEIARLESTNDKVKRPAAGPMRHNAPEAVARLLSEVAADPVARSLVGPQLEDVFDGGDAPAVLARRNAARHALQALANFAAWRREHASVLVDEPAPF